jgi:hypothetical protein
MRTPALVLLAAAAFGSATAAFAQVQTPSTMQPPIPEAQGNGQPANNFGATPSREQIYFRHVATLREKMRKLTAEDGGQLTQDHAAALQKELDDLNRLYRVKVASR